MSDNVWIYKDDGTLQCGEGTEIPLNEMQTELETLGATVLDSEKRQDCRFIVTMCGAPTGQVNAYQISREDWRKISSGIVGPLGFRVWSCGESAMQTLDDALPWPLSLPVKDITSVGTTPVMIRELIGRPCRVYHQGDALTEDFRPERVNIELVAGGEKITDIWFG